MLASKARLSSLTTLAACCDAIESIENDYNNYHGGLERWNSGRTTTLKAGAVKKIAAINVRLERYEDEV